MADLRRRCPTCKRQFRPPKGSPRRYCETCRPSKARLLPVEAAPVVEAGAIEAAVTAELERVERTDTIEGQALLALARDADRLTGAARAAAIRELVKLKPVAFEGTAPKDRDRVDELADRRAALRGA